MTHPLRLISVTRKPGSASFEQRIANWAPPLSEHGITVEHRVLPPSRRSWGALLRELRGADAVWWHRHIMWTPQAARVRKAARRWVIDYDDALTYSSRGGGSPSWARRRRFAATVGRADAVLTASAFLADLARPYCRRIEIAPMAVDLPDALPQRAASPDKLTLLWLGSASTQPYLSEIAPALARLGDGVRLRLVGGQPTSIDGVETDYRPWSAAEQEAALRETDLGLCPMPDSIWTRGKCPYKVLQYMAYGLPWIGSAVGENLTAAGDRDEPRGLCASDAESWAAAIRRLAGDAALRQAMGRRGRAYIEQVHSRPALTAQLVRFWREVAG